jgi:hypothetical protein
MKVSGMVAAPREQAVVAQDHGPPVADVGDQARLFVRVDGDALEVVVRHLAMQLRAVETVVRQPRFQARHRAAAGGVGVHHAVRAGDRAMDRRVGDEAGAVDRVLGRAQRNAVDIDRDQVVRRDLAVVRTD